MSTFVPDSPPDVASGRGALEALWRHRWLLIAIVVMLPAAAYALSSQREERYEAKAVLQMDDSRVDASVLGAPPPDATASQQTVAAGARLVKTRPVAQAAAQRLQPPTPGLTELLDRVTVTTDVDSGFLTITAEDRRPARAAEVANGFAAALIQTRAERAQAQIDGTIAQLQRILEALPRGDPGRPQLVTQVQRLRALRAVQAYNAELVEPASAPADPASPRPLRDASIAFMLALLVGASVAAVLDRFDRRLRDPLELEHLVRAPLLAAVPARASRPWRRDDPTQAFQGLRANLSYLSSDRPLTTLVVASPLRGDGKTTVATGLAVAHARAGKSVVLVDADLRQPRGKRPLDVRTDTGLSQVLLEGLPVHEALVDIGSDRAGELRILPSGPPLANPSDVLAVRMPEVLAELRKQADLIVVDTPAALAAADAMSLLEDASGVILVARVGKTTRQAISQVARDVSRAGGTVLGVVATHVRPTRLWGLGPGGGLVVLRQRPRGGRRADRDARAVRSR